MNHDRVSRPPIEKHEEEPAGWQPPRTPVDRPRFDTDLMVGDVSSLVADGKITPDGKKRLETLFQSFTPEEFDAVWKFLRDLPVPDSQKERLYYLAMTRMAVQGGFEQAKLTIDGSVGKGTVKQQLLESLYAASGKSVEEILKDSRGRPDSGEKAALYGPLATRIGKEKDLSKIDWASLGSLEGEEANWVASGLKSRLAKDIKDPAMFKETFEHTLQVISDLEKNGQADGDMAGRFLQQATSLDPFASWETYSSLRSGMSEGMAGDLDSRIAMSMAKLDPKKAVGLIAGHGQDAALGSAIKTWLAQDGSQAEGWVNSRASSLTPGELDSVALAMIRHSVAAGETDAASGWAKRIQSVETSQAAEAILSGAGKSR